jgi:hypothetical protein
MTIKRPPDAELAEIADLPARATPGPWHVRHLDDEHAMNLVAISTEPDTRLGERWPNFDHATMIAATLVQQPRYENIADERWNVNAAFIAAARTAARRLLAGSHGSGTCGRPAEPRLLTRVPTRTALVRLIPETQVLR